MKLLLDTHIAVWLVSDLARLSVHSREILATSDVLVSAVSLWEMRIKWDLVRQDGRRKGPIDPGVALADLIAAGAELVPLTASQAIASLAVPLGHRDPFDEALLIQAQELGARLLTAGQKLRDHPLAFAA